MKVSIFCDQKLILRDWKLLNFKVFSTSIDTTNLNRFALLKPLAKPLIEVILSYVNKESATKYFDSGVWTSKLNLLRY